MKPLAGFKGKRITISSASRPSAQELYTAGAGSCVHSAWALVETEHLRQQTGWLDLASDFGYSIELCMGPLFISQVLRYSSCWMSDLLAIETKLSSWDSTIPQGDQPDLPSILGKAQENVINHHLMELMCILPVCICLQAFSQHHCQAHPRALLVTWDLTNNKQTYARQHGKYGSEGMIRCPVSTTYGIFVFRGC